jgi:hypothetical protein
MGFALIDCIIRYLHRFIQSPPRAEVLQLSYNPAVSVSNSSCADRAVRSRGHGPRGSDRLASSQFIGQTFRQGYDMMHNLLRGEGSDLAQSCR